MTRRLSGLYAITPDQSGTFARTVPSLTELVAEAIQGGAQLIQYRDKGPDDARRIEIAAALLRLCHAGGVPLVINDDLELAAAVGADGVHLGRDDADLRVARERLGPDSLVGASCYDRLDLARAAARAGASYVAFGSFFPSPTKPGALRPEPSLLMEARRTLRLPLVAIGGITPQNAGALIAAGADMVAVLTGVFAAPDIAAAARAYSRLFSGPGRPTEDPNEPIP
jgi:thiamine-phosphate pyrophosphorylase